MRARALMSALIKCNAAQLKMLAVVLVITTFSFYASKFGLQYLLTGLEAYERTLKEDRIKDGLEPRARATLYYSAVFWLSIIGSNFIIYIYFRPWPCT